MGSDMGEEWREWHEEFKEKKSITAALNETRLELVFPKRYKIVQDSRVAIFREPGKPKVDYYYSRNKWRVAGKRKIFSGDFNSFENWYNKQTEAK